MDVHVDTLLNRLRLGHEAPEQLNLSDPVHTPFGGALLYPLQATVCSPMEAASVLGIARCLLELGAPPNIAWCGVDGCHTPLSRALCLGNLQLAQLLVEAGADCTFALLRTDLLERSCFDPLLVGWLLDRGADPAAPLQRSSGGQPYTAALACPTDGRGACAPRCRCPPVPAVGLLLSKLQQELHVSRQLSKLHAAAGSGQEAWLLRRAAGCLQRLLAAGAAPAGAPDASGTVVAAVSAMQPADWGAVRSAAFQPPEWTPEKHYLFPRRFREAAREVLLVARRGFSLPANPEAGSPGSAAQEANRCCGAQKHATAWWLDGGIVLCIIKQLAPSAAHAGADRTAQPWEPSC
ncbi:hypothetical protein ABPG75_004148 [Micractinium tetrahymenae]